MPHTYEYPRPALTVDCVVFGVAFGLDNVAANQHDLELVPVEAKT